MKILYDHQIFSLQKYGGISRYFYELIKEFNHTESVYPSTSIIFSNNHYISDKKYIPHMNFMSTKEFRGKNKLNLLLNKIATIIKLKGQHFDVFHPTYYDPYFLEYIKDKPFVLTVHDMIHEKFSDKFSSNDKDSVNKKILVEKASKIIAVSQSTKDDLIEIFGIKPSKIEVIYHGNSMLVNKKLKLDIEVPEKYILFVGVRGGYKNFNKFINAVSNLLLENNNLSIVCVGGGKFNNEELFVFKKLNIQNKIFQFSLNDEILAQFYKKALMSVFPSLYEGFGIPVLESFACECPLVCSNTSSLPEVAGNGAQYFDPSSEKSIFEAIKKVLDNKEEREILIKNGAERLKYFSWKKTALKTKQIYEECCSN